MRKPRVFISHVNGDASADALLTGLQDALERASLSVLLDRKDLKDGDPWRHRIFSWIGTCDAAVVLVSRKAVEDGEKYWVPREAACLACRKAIHPGLQLRFMLLDGIKVADLRVSPFKDLGIEEWQCRQVTDEAQDIVEVVETLKALQGSTSRARTGFARLAEELAECLQQAPPGCTEQDWTVRLASAAAQLELEVADVGERDHRFELAAYMLALEPQGTVRALDELKRRGLKTETIESLARCVAANWVSPEQAADGARTVLGRAGEPREPIRVRVEGELNISRNAKQIAGHLISRTVARRPDKVGRLVPITPFGEGGAAEVEEQIMTELRAAFPNPDLDNEDILDNAIGLAKELGYPWFIFVADDVAGASLEDVTDRFRSGVLLVGCSSASGPAPVAAAPAIVVEASRFKQALGADLQISAILQPSTR